MKHNYFYCLFFMLSSVVFSQDSFRITSNKEQVKIPFTISNNLIIIQVKLNGVDLNFLVDTGVEKTILFGIDEKSTLEFKDAEKIKIKGLGAGESIDAYHTKKNQIKIGGYENISAEVFIILDENINFSSQLGIPVHGIIGSNFFKNNLIEINYISKKISILNSKNKSTLKKIRNFYQLPISVELEKPYIITQLNLNEKLINAKMLIDTGGSDALWLFENDGDIKIPKNNFDDFLGKGFSGDIYGKRSRINYLKLGSYVINKPTVSFPDTLALKNVALVKGRNGSIGSEILKRFTIIFDYSNSKIFFKENTNFNDPFNYNMSGLEIVHDGVQLIQEKTELKTTMVANEISVIDERNASVKYQFVLKPNFIISSVRHNSPGEIAGLQKEDKLIKINGIEAYRYKLDEIINLMQSEEGKWINIEIERKGKRVKTKFQLKKIL